VHNADVHVSVGTNVLTSLLTLPDP
jgi:hypothetical protein